MRPHVAALVIAASLLAAALGAMCGTKDMDPLRTGQNATTRERVYQTCLDEADRITDGAESYADYEERVAEAADRRRECERIYGTVVREGTVEAQGWEGDNQ